MDRHSLSEGLVTYREMMFGAPLHECALVYDPRTGTYYAVQGGRDSIQLRSIREEGLVVIRHSHPVVETTDAAHPGDRLPSTEDMGELALITPPGEFRAEAVDFQRGGGETGHTVFRVDKRNGRVECSVTMYFGDTVVFERSFDRIEDYQAFLGRTFDAPGQLPEGSTQVNPNAPDEDY